ncbi:hypothetical protein MRX96_026820 [Rhipicephalus microplus]
MAGVAAVEAKTDELDYFCGEDGHVPLKQTQDWRSINIAPGLTEGQRTQLFVQTLGFLSFGWNTGLLVSQVEFCDNLPACGFYGFFDEKYPTTQPLCLAVPDLPIRPAAGSHYHYTYTSLHQRLQHQCASRTLSTVPLTEQINPAAAKWLVSGHGSMYGMTGLHTFPPFVKIFAFLSFGWNTVLRVDQIEFCDSLPACDFYGFFDEKSPTSDSTTLPACSGFACSPGFWLALPAHVHFAAQKT